MPLFAEAMVRFLCFNAHIHSHKPKKTTMEVMHKRIHDFSQIQTRGETSRSKSFNSVSLEAGAAQGESTTTKPATTSACLDDIWKPDKTDGKFEIENDTRLKPLKKSQSLGSALYLKGRASVIDDTDDGTTDQGAGSGSGSGSGSHEHNGSSPYQEPPCSESVQVSVDQVDAKSIFSPEGPQHSDKYSGSSRSGEHAYLVDNHSPQYPSGMVKSASLSQIADSMHTSIRHHFKYLANRAKSSSNLQLFEFPLEENSVYDIEQEAKQREERDNSTPKSEASNLEIFADGTYNSYKHTPEAKDWVVPATDEMSPTKIHQEESSAWERDELPDNDYKIKRIQEWVSDIQHCTPLEEVNELPEYYDKGMTESHVSTNLATAKVDGNEAVKKYISSLSSSSTTAHLVNHGLVVIPLLSALNSLRMLNLSGNAIDRITAGSLPRGLHALNLSKNKITTIEGLRELTRLRVLDLSYNRILRVGHGLASCSSLKELYLAGNKISEVEGLHRLLKLTVLDLRCNKISTSKCLDQLAANYNSLQAISLEGNPVQKNVGDEQLKKHLQRLLPYLAYFNRHPTKHNSLKDTADLPLRLGSSRPEIKATRRSSHGAASLKLISSSTHTNQVMALTKKSKNRSGRGLPSPRAKVASGYQPNYSSYGTKLANFRSELSLRASGSEGNLRAL